jgi:hypothetical protein
MRKLNRFTGIAACLLFLTFFVINSANAQDAVKGDENKGAIPAGILKITEKSCTACHSGSGNADAVAKLDLSAWGKYSPDKQASKAQAMCIMISKDKMPPREYRTNHPESELTTEEIKAVYAWAQALRNAKE